MVPTPFSVRCGMAVLATCLLQSLASTQTPTAKPQSPAAMPAPTLATSATGKDVAPTELVLTVEHVPPAGAACGKATAPARCEEVAHWRGELQVHGADGTSTAQHTFLMTDLAALRKPLQGTADRWREKGEPRRISTARLSFRIGSDTPFGVVQQLLAEAACAGVWRVEFAVRDAAGKERQIPTPLPWDTGVKEADAEDLVKEIGSP